jgi:hypothetical protein
MEDETSSVAREAPPLCRLRAGEHRCLEGASEVVAARRGVDLLGDGLICVEGPSGSGELQPRAFASVIIATHDPKLATRASRLISLKDGPVVQDKAR